MDSICNFIPPKQSKGEIKYYHFVYEASLKTLRQPFLHAFYRAHLVVKGNGTLKINNKKYSLHSGTLFFTFPYQPYEISDIDDLKYLYISFEGSIADGLLKSLKIDADNCNYPSFEHVTNFWMSAIRRINSENANILTEGVLMYTLSFIDNRNHLKKSQSLDKFDLILEYIDNNFSDPTTSLKKVAEIFFYSEKYLSSLFKKNTNQNFSDYLNGKRIKYAIKLLDEKTMNVSEIGLKCGFNDPFYFSKVFKKITGLTPTAYIKKLKSGKA